MDIVKNLYTSWTEARLRGEQAGDDEAWGGLTTEPRGVDYIETDAGGVPAMWVTPKQAAADRVILGIHGGGFVIGSIYSHRKLFAHLAKAVGARALIFDYRLAPEHRHPAALDDSVTAYSWLLDQGVSPDHIAFAGDSAGGGLAITTQLSARLRGLPLPAAALLLSPWVDLALTSQTHETNRTADALFDKEFIQTLVDIYLREDDDRRDPLISPIHADLAGLPPIYIQVGDDETLLDDARLMDEHARKAGVDVRLDVFPGMQHTFQMAAGRSPDADEAIRRLAEWTRPRLGL